MSGGQKWSLGEDIRLCPRQKEDQKKRAEQLLSEGPGSWTQNLRDRVGPNPAHTAAAGVTWAVSWCVCRCPGWTLLGGHFLPKGRLSLASHGSLSLDVGMVETKDGQEPTHTVPRVNRTRRWQLSSCGSPLLEQAWPHRHVTPGGPQALGSPSCSGGIHSHEDLGL